MKIMATIMGAACGLATAMVALRAHAQDAGTPAPAGATRAPKGESPGIVPTLPAAPGSRVDVPPNERAPATRTFPAIGGHVGTAVPLVTFARDTTAIGADFVTIGLTPGITVHLDERWAIDFEFIALNELKNTPSRTTFVVDPGLLRKFDGFVAGLRVATQVGAPTNIGLVPIVVVPFKLSDRVSWFIEADAPLFLRDDGDAMRASATALLQTGFGF